RRGSADEYLLAARSVRAGTPLFLAMTSICGSSDSVQDRKSHACSACEGVAPMPGVSPPANVDSPPARPLIGAAPGLMLAADSITPSQTAGPGAMPILPLCNAPSHVGPASSFDVGAATPSS